MRIKEHSLNEFTEQTTLLKRLCVPADVKNARKLGELIRQRKKKTINVLASELPIGVFAEILSHLDAETRIQAFALLDPKILAKLIDELPLGMEKEIVKSVPASILAKVLAELKDDDAVDLMQEMPTKKIIAILRALPEEKRENIEKLLKYPPDTAGGLMTKELVKLDEKTTVGDAINLLRSEGRVPHNVVYVTKKDGQLIGEVELKNLLLANPWEKVGSIAKKPPARIRPYTDREDVIRIFSDEDVTALPVVDEKDRILGVITIDDVVDAIEEEAGEDLARITGSTEKPEKMLYMSTMEAVGARIPWLIFTVLGETIFTGQIIKMFEGVLAKYLSLSFFLPALMCLSGDSAVQSSTLVIRGTALRELKHPREFLSKDLRVAVVMGSILGLLTALVAVFLFNAPRIGLVVGISIALSVIVSNAIGVMLPIFFEKMNIDPAVSAGPLLTTIMDIISVGVYFLIATVLLILLMK